MSAIIIINTTNFSFHSSLCRKCSASNRILSAKDHASVQINVAEVDESTGNIEDCRGSHKSTCHSQVA